MSKQFQNLINIFLISTSLFLGACAQVNTIDPQHMQVEIGQAPFTFAAPDGFCLDRPTYQRRRGYLNSNVEFSDIVASNCSLENNEAKAEKLTHMISIGASLRSAADDFILSNVNAEKNSRIKKIGDTTFMHSKIQQFDAERAFFETGEHVVTIQVADLLGGHKDNTHQILLNAIEAIRGANHE